MPMENGKKSSSLMRKLILYFLIIILMMFSLNIFSVYRFKTFYSSFYDMLSDSIDIQSMSMEADGLFTQIENYAHSGSREYIKNHSDRVKKLIFRIDLLQAGSTDTIYFRCRDIKNMLITFEEKGQSVISNYDAGMKQIYINQSVAELSRLKGYIQEEITALLLIRLRSILEFYSGFREQIVSGENLMYLLTAFITLLCVAFAYRFSRHISVPIHQLVLRLKRVARGDLDVEALVWNTNDEIHILIDSFQHMLSQIKSLIERIREKANVENRLKEQEIKNLEIENLLNQSELNFLQSQINPHFLFNTLNSIAVLAEIEEAGQTKMMIESMSSILRYNLQKLNDNVTLREELEIIRNYLYIQRTRYGNRIEFSMDIDESVMNCSIPSMIIQPFVENAIMHGLEPKLGKGLLQVGVYDRQELLEIVVRDDGVGMSQDILEQINNRSVMQDSKKGIGMVNVIRRLEIHYGPEAICIESMQSKGTTVTIRLPRA
jgi:two-component system, sensor histidine kinase YesM